MREDLKKERVKDLSCDSAKQWPAGFMVIPGRHAEEV